MCGGCITADKLHIAWRPPRLMRCAFYRVVKRIPGLKIIFCRIDRGMNMRYNEYVNK